ncbi:MAG TPA: hypothetical protein VGB30_10880 [bacterium]|jgi:hypothetical protein
MKNRVLVLIAVFAFAAAAAFLLTTGDAQANGRGDGGVIYVTSQGLYYDTFATKDPLPPNGRFQLLEMGPNGPQTEFGPGDRGYLGGRWMEDFDGDGEYHYFLCPLLGPGREEP